MKMFDNYDNLDPEYIPNNISKDTDTNYIILDNTLPRPIYDIKNNFIGYTWDEGEFFDLNISVNDKIKVKENSIIFNCPGEYPDTYTAAEIKGQQAYNTADGKSWTYVGKANDLHIWIEDIDLIYPINGDKIIEINTDMIDNHIELDIYNFRWEKIYSKTGETGKSNIVLQIDEEMSEILKPSVYYVIVKICSEETQYIKSRFMININ